MALDLTDFAFSFSHAIVRVNDRQFTDIEGVSISQPLTEGAVYGTNVAPLKRSVGQLALGRGSLKFSDMGEAFDFFSALGAQPFMALWQLNYVMTKSGGTLRSIDCTACRILDVGVDHQAGSGALGMTYPFSFMKVKLNGIDLTLDPKTLIQAGLSLAQNLTNLL